MAPEEALEDVGPLLPLGVLEIRVNDPVVSLAGDDWSLVLACPWDLVTPEETVVWDDPRIDDAAWDLVGTDLSDVRVEAGDPVFEFSGGCTVRVRADSDLDPWVLSVPGLVVVGRKPSADG